MLLVFLVLLVFLSTISETSTVSFNPKARQSTQALQEEILTAYCLPCSHPQRPEQHRPQYRECHVPACCRQIHQPRHQAASTQGPSRPRVLQYRGVLAGTVLEHRHSKRNSHHLRLAGTAAAGEDRASGHGLVEAVRTLDHLGVGPAVAGTAGHRPGSPEHPVDHRVLVAGHIGAGPGAGKVSDVYSHSRSTRE
jgi:hypothetical protein